MKITRDLRRKIIQVAAFGFTNSHLGNFAAGSIYQGSWKNFCSPGLNCYSCPAAGFACPIGAMQAVGGSPKYGISFYAVGFALALGVIFGRAVCGYLCPFGLIQELLNRIPSPKKRIPKPLTYIKYVLLFGLVLLFPVFVTDEFGYGSPAFCEYICPAGTLEGGLPLLITHPELRAQLGGIFIAKAAILLLTIAGCIVVFRFFCKVMCPLGAIYGLLNKVSFCRVHVKETGCVSCGKCRDICPMDVNPVKQPDSAECIRCGKCAAACPENILSVGFVNNQNNLTAQEGNDS
ncbi:MAG: 4Fe-4S binding protein [Bacillota bacterium]